MPRGVEWLRRRGGLAALLGAGIAALVAGGGAAAERSVGLTITVAGKGTAYSVRGTVPGGGPTVLGISCSSECSYDFRGDETLTLAVKAGPDFEFIGWSGLCVGVATKCALATEGGGTVRATFRRVRDDVQLVVAGGGTVVSVPAGLACGVGRIKCEAGFEDGSRFVLHARAKPGFAFAGWSDLEVEPLLAPPRVCRGQGANCTVTARRWIGVAATFRRLEPRGGTLSVQARPMDPGPFFGGAVISVPAGIRCPTRCSAQFTAATRVRLRTPYPPYLGAEWSGACVGVGTECPVIVDGDLTISARVEVEKQGATPQGFGVAVTVTGQGTVTDGGRIRCGVTARTATECGAFFGYRKTLVLRAIAEPGFRFGGWGDFCSGTKETCELRILSNKSVTALFRRS